MEFDQNIYKILGIVVSIEKEQLMSLLTSYFHHILADQGFLPFQQKVHDIVR